MDLECIECIFSSRLSKMSITEVVNSNFQKSFEVNLLVDYIKSMKSNISVFAVVKTVNFGTCKLINKL